MTLRALLATRLAKAVYATLLMWFVVSTSFVATMHAQQVLEQLEAPVEAGEPVQSISWVFAAPLYTYAGVGLLADVAFNWSAGIVIYGELPREFLFTTRSRRHLSSGGRDQERAEWWCGQLELFDPGHCE